MIKCEIKALKFNTEDNIHEEISLFNGNVDDGIYYFQKINVHTGTISFFINSQYVVTRSNSIMFWSKTGKEIINSLR